MRLLFICSMGILAVFWDFCTGKIPNVLIGTGMLTGIAWQWSANGPPGILNFLGGSMLPLGILGILHYFKMMGAGDLKYFMMVGGFLNLEQSLKCICISFLIAAVFSMTVVVKHRILKKRLILFIQYIKNFYSTGIWQPYIEAETNPAYLHLSLPIFLGSVLVTGGWI